MNKLKIKNYMMALAFSTIVGFGFTSCNKGTEAGETNVERSEIVDTEHSEADQDPAYRDTSNLERHYDHADHENHGDNTDGGAVHAGDGQLDDPGIDEAQQ
ncbi:hypothetical protein [Pontibacter harenae]|uniref:hypothetical protein n=1 Tax=Pontibacter harenae TaxID=2894083 RepID=UPI001E2CF831|nr:hypothetical protein [Pontibacter harenae]MCC9165826.1 hypothetical protein [Pontibacter harenae]